MLLVADNPVFLVDPGAEIDEAAAFGTEGSGGIPFPVRGSAAPGAAQYSLCHFFPSDKKIPGGRASRGGYGPHLFMVAGFEFYSENTRKVNAEFGTRTGKLRRLASCRT
jgi:hypothetical protein